MTLFRRRTGKSAEDRFQYGAQSKTADTDRDVSALQGGLAGGRLVTGVRVSAGAESRIEGTTRASGGLVVNQSAAGASYCRVVGGVLYVGCSSDVTVDVWAF